MFTGHPCLILCLLSYNSFLLVMNIFGSWVHTVTSAYCFQVLFYYNTCQVILQFQSALYLTLLYKPFSHLFFVVTAMSTPPINLRGVHLARSKKHLAISAIAAVMAFGGVMAWREKRKRKFQQFYQYVRVCYIILDFISYN